MKNLFYRVLTAVILLPMVIFAFYKGGTTLLYLLGLASLVGCLEAALVIDAQNRSSKVLALLFWAGFFLTNLASDISVVLVLLLLMLFLFNMFVLFCAQVDRAAYERYCAIFSWCFYICFGLSSLYWLCSSSTFDSNLGCMFMITACISTFSNDTFAYFGGRFFGRHFLFPRVSGKKTWEGFISGSIFSVMIVILVKYISEHFGYQWFHSVSLKDILWISLPVIVLAPLGDLIESRFKRLYDKKDSSQILPGHGGLLDRIDSLLLVIPWTALYAFIIRGL